MVICPMNAWMMLRKTLGLVFCLLLLGCKSSDPPSPPDLPVNDGAGKAKVWLTKGDKSKLFNQEGDLTLTRSNTGSWPIIVVDTTQTFQTIHGFGAALTGSSAYLLNKKMSSGARQTLLRQLFDTVNGAGISYLRLTIGASDFSMSDYTYDDLAAGQTDFPLEMFSLARDEEDVIPMLQEILQISPDIHLMGSPWSPPAWMKTNGNLKGGKLKSNCYEVYAAYFVRYIHEMKQRGINIRAVTPQNEPLFATASYPCMEMQPAEQQTFIKSNLGPAFASAGISTKIVIYDHNWDNTAYANTVLNDPDARSYIAGTAFHAYAGDVSAMTTIHNAFPDKELYFTEISGGAWATNFGSNLMWNMKNIFIGSTRNWSTTALLWNLALDQNYGPQNKGCNNCRGVVTINQSNGQVTRNEEFYSIAHFSKTVRPGAVRVGISLPVALSDLYAVAFVNTDKSKTMVVCNPGTVEKSFTVSQGGRIFNYTVPAVSVVTFLWL